MSLLKHLTDPVAFAIGRWWLSGPKYTFSRLLAGDSWNWLLSAALPSEDFLKLVQAQTPQEIADAFRGKVFWKPDPVFQAWDVVRPPAQLYARGGDDCDGMAMLHAQAIAFALGRRGWTARIASYLADPWWRSHHVALAISPDDNVWVFQPQPTQDMLRDVPVVFGPWNSVHDAIQWVADAYGVKLVWYDIRDPHWNPVQE